MFTNLTEFTKYERARIIGARSLQIAMGAPTLAKLKASQIDPHEIARIEFEKGIVPLTIKRNLPISNLDDNS